MEAAVTTTVVVEQATIKMSVLLLVAANNCTVVQPIAATVKEECAFVAVMSVDAFPTTTTHHPRHPRPPPRLLQRHPLLHLLVAAAEWQISRASARRRVSAKTNTPLPTIARTAKEVSASVAITRFAVACKEPRGITFQSKALTIKNNDKN